MKLCLLDCLSYSEMANLLLFTPISHANATICWLPVTEYYQKISINPAGLTNEDLAV
jgi:hypothetical protein